MFEKMTEDLGKVSSLARKVHLQRLNKICDIHCVVFFLPKDRILFEQILY